MPPRALRRRGGSQRWLIVPLVLTMIVLLVDASMHARSSAPQTRMSSQAWVDTVLPYIAESTLQGREIAQISSDRLIGGSGETAGQLTRIAAAASSTYREITVVPPAVGSSSRRASWKPASSPVRENGATEMAVSGPGPAPGGRLGRGLADGARPFPSSKLVTPPTGCFPGTCRSSASRCRLRNGTTSTAAYRLSAAGRVRSAPPSPPCRGHPRTNSSIGRHFHAPSGFEYGRARSRSSSAGLLVAGHGGGAGCGPGRGKGRPCGGHGHTRTGAGRTSR